MRTTLSVFLLLSATACSPARVLAGGGIAAAGLGVTSAALDSMSECPREAAKACPSRYRSTPPVVAMPIAAAGLGIAFLGAVVMSQRSEQRARAPTQGLDRPAPPVADAPPPLLLDETTAVGMAVARLSLIGITLHSKPTKLLGVDETQASLHVDGERAQLWNLRVRTTSDSQWHPVHACFELGEQWQLVKVGTAPGCAR